MEVKTLRVAVVGSRNIKSIDIGILLPGHVTEIISGGARGVDAAARIWALAHDIPLHEFLPDYRRYGRSAPLRRNDAIVATADYVIIVWDGVSRGTRYVLKRCIALRKPFRLVMATQKNFPNQVDRSVSN